MIAPADAVGKGGGPESSDGTRFALAPLAQAGDVPMPAAFQGFQVVAERGSEGGQRLLAARGGLGVGGAEEVEEGDESGGVLAAEVVDQRPRRGVQVGPVAVA